MQTILLNACITLVYINEQNITFLKLTILGWNTQKTAELQQTEHGYVDGYANSKSLSLSNVYETYFQGQIY